MRLVYLLYALSGFISLGYQVSWFRIFVDRFGSTNFTFGLVIGNFIGGLGVGSLLSARVERGLERFFGPERALARYGLIEILVALTALFTLLLTVLPADLLGSFPYVLEDGIHQPTATYRLLHLGLAALCVFLPCFFMGVTFPMLCRFFHRDEQVPAALYAWNTLGAALGILVNEFILLSLLGHEASFLLMVVLNLALGCVFVFRTGASGRGPREGEEPTPRRALGRGAGFGLAVAVLASVMSGLLSGAFEADVLRRLQFLDCRTDAAMSCISFWAILAIFLASFSVRMWPGMRLRTIQIGYVVAWLLYALLWWKAQELRAWFNEDDLQEVMRNLPRDRTGLGVSYDLHYFRYGLMPILLFTGLFVFPTFYLTSLLLPFVCNRMQEEGRHLGVVYGLNTLGFCFGMLAFTLFAPAVDAFYALNLFPWIFAALVLGVAILGLRRGGFWAKPAVVAVIGILAIFLTPSGFDVDFVDPGSSAALYPVRGMRSNGMHTTYVVADPRGDFLYFDNHTMSGCNLPAQRYMRLMAHFPLLMHEEPKSALLICFGVGNTASAIAKHASVGKIDVVDLNDQVIRTAPEFAATNDGVAEDPRIRFIHDDGRRFLDLSDERYDLITSEPPPPMFAGMFRLYSKEYYEAARAHLNEGGFMSQWLPIGQMPEEAVAESIATFIEVFPHSVVFSGSDTNYIIMGSTMPLRFETLERRYPLVRPAVRDLQKLGINAPVHLLARIVKLEEDLEEDYGHRDLISDQGAGFGHDFMDPARPAVIAYDPLEILEHLRPRELACMDVLEETLTHLGRLKYMVDDFPVSALESVPEEDRDRVQLSRADWRGLNRIREVAIALVEKGKAEEAAKILVKGLNDNEQSVPSLFECLADLTMLAGQPETALEAFRRICSLAPGNAVAHFRLAECLAQLKRFEEAIPSYERAIQLNTGELAIFHTRLGDALLKLGRKAEALRSFDRALALDPQDIEASMGRARAVKGGAEKAR